MNTEIITIGDELLIGQVIDTNSAWLGQSLNLANIRVNRIHTISDDKEEIFKTLQACILFSDLIIITGGLGPTRDDVTKRTLAEFFNTGWREDPSVIEQLESFYQKRNRLLTDVNRLQARLPDSCITLFNYWGTAPGMWFEKDGKVIISLPGVPYEMKHIFEKEALPKIKERFHQPELIHRTILTYNVPESIIAKQLTQFEDELPGHIKLAYLPNWDVVRLRLSAVKAKDSNLSEEIEILTSKIKSILKDAVIAVGDLSMAEVVFQNLDKYGKTLSIAESCTGGYLSSLLTQISGASRIFVGSVVSYSNSVKHHQLGVESTLFETVGAVSSEVVTAMAEGVRHKLKTDYSISVSGVAGPDGGSAEKPVGTVFIGVSSENNTIVKEVFFTGHRANIIERSANMGFNMLRELMIQELG